MRRALSGNMARQKAVEHDLCRMNVFSAAIASMRGTQGRHVKDGIVTDGCGLYYDWVSSSGHHPPGGDLELLTFPSGW